MESENDQVINSLNFSGDQNSWFDLWHLHIEEGREFGTESDIRSESLVEAIRLFRKLQKKLEGYPHEYQLWIEVYDEYVGDDAIFIHTNNPNGSEFPISVSTEFPVLQENEELRLTLERSGLTIKGQRIMNGNIYCLFDTATGVPL